jgi:hypothetical protein
MREHDTCPPDEFRYTDEKEKVFEEPMRLAA